MTERVIVPLTQKDLESIQEIIVSAAESEIMPRFRNLSEAEIETKSDPYDFVTEADKAAEKAITRGLRAAFPTAFVFGEEAVDANPGLLSKLKDFLDILTILAHFVLLYRSSVQRLTISCNDLRRINLGT